MYTCIPSLFQHVNNQKNTNRSRSTVLLSPAERKVFVVFLYYLFSGVLQLSTFSLVIKSNDHNIKALGSYFQCQRSGLNESCSLDTRFIEFWSLLAFIVLLLLPVINLYFALKLKSVFLLCKSLNSQVIQLHRKTVSNSVSS